MKSHQNRVRSEQNPIQTCDVRGECLWYREGVGCHCIAFPECPEGLPTWIFIFRVSGMVPLANPSANMRPKSDPPCIGRISDPEAPGRSMGFRSINNGRATFPNHPGSTPCNKSRHKAFTETRNSIQTLPNSQRVPQGPCGVRVRFSGCLWVFQSENWGELEPGSSTGDE